MIDEMEAGWLVRAAKNEKTIPPCLSCQSHYTLVLPYLAWLWVRTHIYACIGSRIKAPRLRFPASFLAFRYCGLSWGRVLFAYPFPLLVGFPSFRLGTFMPSHAGRYPKPHAQIP
jgi:hypothetical protein